MLIVNLFRKVSESKHNFAEIVLIIHPYIILLLFADLKFAKTS